MGVIAGPFPPPSVTMTTIKKYEVRMKLPRVSQPLRGPANRVDTFSHYIFVILSNLLLLILQPRPCRCYSNFYAACKSSAGCSQLKTITNESISPQFC